MILAEAGSTSTPPSLRKSSNQLCADLVDETRPLDISKPNSQAVIAETLIGTPVSCAANIAFVAASSIISPWEIQITAQVSRRKPLPIFVGLPPNRIDWLG